MLYNTSMTNLEKISLLCTDNGKTKNADVLSKSDKYLKVVVEGTTMTIELSRSDLNKPYVGNKAGLEFTYGEWKFKI